MNVVHNPHNKPVEDLPTIFGYIAAVNLFGVLAIALAEDGTELAGHLCSNVSWAHHDLGIHEGSPLSKHAFYRAHYPDGYKMEFVYLDDPRLIAIIGEHEC